MINTCVFFITDGYERRLATMTRVMRATFSSVWDLLVATNTVDFVGSRRHDTTKTSQSFKGVTVLEMSRV